MQCLRAKLKYLHFFHFSNFTATAQTPHSMRRHIVVARIFVDSRVTLRNTNFSTRSNIVVRQFDVEAILTKMCLALQRQGEF